MSGTLDKPPCTHRAEQPTRECPGCGTYLASPCYNPTEKCWSCGGWVDFEFSDTWDLLIKANPYQRKKVADAMAELMEVAP